MAESKPEGKLMFDDNQEFLAHYANTHKDASSVYQEGRKARQDAVPIIKNPYDTKTVFHLYWHVGWTDEDKLLIEMKEIIKDYHQENE
jgi:hypothetical protein